MSKGWRNGRDTAWFYDLAAETAQKIVLRRCWCLYFCFYLTVCISLPISEGFEGTACSCVSLLWGSWNPFLSFCPAPRHQLHSPSQTSAGLWCLLCCPAPDHRDSVSPIIYSNERRNKNNKKGDKDTSILFTCFFFIIQHKRRSCLISADKKQAIWGLGTLGCRTDWLHGQSSQGLSLCPTAFQTASGLREFCLRQNKKIN